MSSIKVPTVSAANPSPILMPVGMAYNGEGLGASTGSMSQNFSGPPGMFDKALGGNSFAAGASLDQLVRQEQHLGYIRELTPPEEHIGLQFAPFMDVATDDVVIDYINSTGSGLAPAVAQDAESDLFQDTEDITGQMRASLIDWRLKSVYTSSDVMTYRDMKATAENLNGQGAALPLYVNSVLDGFNTKVARDTARRKLWLDNRIEWLILTAIQSGKIVYNDGKIKFTVDFKRPANQHQVKPLSGTYASDTHDPIGDINAVVEWGFNTLGVVFNRAICSRKFLNTLYKSAKFGPRTGFPAGANVDPNYVLDGWGPQVATDIVQRETGVQFIVNDNIFRARNMQTGVVTNTRYIPEDEVIFLPSEESIALVDGTGIGFAKTLTSPHPMGNFTSGFYTWEAEQTDPWQHVIGSGIKAFPVFPFMNKTFSWKVTLPPSPTTPPTGV